MSAFDEIAWLRVGDLNLGCVAEFHTRPLFTVAHFKHEVIHSSSLTLYAALIDRLID